MATKVIADDEPGASRPGLSLKEIRAEDRASNVAGSLTTSRGSQSSLAKTKAKKAALIAKQKRHSERVALEQ